MLGNWAIGRLRIVREPTSTRTKEITIATIGRLMKNFDMTLPAYRFRGEWFRIDTNPGTDLLDTFGDNPIPWIKPTCYHPAPIHLWPDCHRPNVHLVIGVNDCYLIATLELRDGALRNQQRSLFCSDYRTNFGVATGLENVIGIGKKSRQPNCAGALIHLTVGEVERPIVGIGRTVRQNQLKPKLLVRLQAGGLCGNALTPC